MSKDPLQPETERQTRSVRAQFVQSAFITQKNKAVHLAAFTAELPLPRGRDEVHAFQRRLPKKIKLLVSNRQEGCSNHTSPTVVFLGDACS